jgi:hypothetical protein
LLLVAAGQFTAFAAGVATELQGIEHREHPLSHPGRSDSPDSQRQGHVVAHAPVGQNFVVLENDRHVPAQLDPARLAQPGQVVAGHAHPALLQRQGTVQNP